MEDVSAGALLDLKAFIPLRVKRLQRFCLSKDEWESEHERWLRMRSSRLSRDPPEAAHAVETKEAAWRAAPSLTRLLRWLAVDGHEQEPLPTKATRAVARCPKTAVRQVALLRVLLGDVAGAATLLSKSPGLGWSNPDHPGHTLFPLLATLLSNGVIGDALVTEFEATAQDPLESLAMTDG